MTTTSARPEMDAVAREWWDATREKRLLVQRCRGCGEHQFYPRSICRACGDPDVSFVAASGRGTVYSFTVVHRAPSADFVAPYAVALVRLAEGPLMLTRILATDLAAIACDQAVDVRWLPLEDGRHLPVFSAAEEG